MQTPAERSLIDHVAAVGDGHFVHVLNIGAAQSLIIEKALVEKGLKFTSDRIDIETCSVKASYVGHCFQASIEKMTGVLDGEYDVAFANYVLEHIVDIKAAALEIKRILKPKAYFIVSTPNPQAPEFKFSRFTPLWLHQVVRGSTETYRAYETVYAYRSIPELVNIFKAFGLELKTANYFPATETYLYRFPIIRHISRAYDKLIAAIGWKVLLGNVCLVFIKQ